MTNSGYDRHGVWRIKPLVTHLIWRGRALACGKRDVYGELLKTTDPLTVTCRKCQGTLRFKLATQGTKKED